MSYRTCFTWVVALVALNSTLAGSALGQAESLTNPYAMLDLELPATKYPAVELPSATRQVEQTTRYDPYHSMAGDAVIDPRKVDIEIGKKAPVIDGVGWVLGIPRKLLLWDRRADNHRVSLRTVDEIANYVENRGLHDTKVRVNQYNPGSEWRRLAANKQVGAGWRYTVGALSTLRYTLLPGRLFGNDNYNPYTNTLSIYSDAPTLGLAEAAYAKDIHERTYPGTYATAQQLPLVAIWHETLATQEVIRYAATAETQDSPDKVRHLLYARYGTEIGGAISGPGSDGLLPVIGAVSGHTTATVKQRFNRDQ